MTRREKDRPPTAEPRPIQNFLLANMNVNQSWCVTLDNFLTQIDEPIRNDVDQLVVNHTWLGVDPFQDSYIFKQNTGQQHLKSLCYKIIITQSYKNIRSNVIPREILLLSTSH